MGSKRSRRRSLTHSLLFLVLALSALLSVRWLLFEPYVIPSGSMIPSLLIHDHILVNKLAFGVRWPFSKKWIFPPQVPRRGDIVVFRSVEDDGFFMIKRVIGLPGDELTYDPEGRLFVNGEPVTRRPLANPNTEGFYEVNENDLQTDFADTDFYVENLEQREYRIILRKQKFRSDFESIRIPKDSIFLMGDNRDNSRDSRYWGTLPLDNLLGRAMFVWLSCEETVGSTPFLCNPLTLRWKRLFHKIQ